jgi:hypothetical protein
MGRASAVTEGERTWQRLWREDALALGEVGEVWAAADLPRIEVRLPRALAERAVAAWERDDDEGLLGTETFEQRTLRHRAGTLALIGLGVTERGRWEGDEVVVELHPDVIGSAVDASDALPRASATDMDDS